MMSIICVYNNENILEEYLIKSLNRQTEKYELILIDNRENKFKSAASALNFGAKKAHGEYLVFAHQDIYFSDENWIKNTTKQLKNLNNTGIVGVAGKTIDSLVRSNIKQGLNPVDVSPFKIAKAEKASTLDECLFIIPKTVFDKYNLNEDICDDCLKEEVTEKLLGYKKENLFEQEEKELKKTKKLGIISLVISILGLMTNNIIFMILAIILGHKSHGTTGRKLGLVAKIIGTIGIIFSIIFDIVFLIILIKFIIPTVLSWYGIFW